MLVSADRRSLLSYKRMECEQLEMTNQTTRFIQRKCLHKLMNAITVSGWTLCIRQYTRYYYILLQIMIIHMKAVLRLLWGNGANFGGPHARLLCRSGFNVTESFFSLFLESFFREHELLGSSITSPSL